MDVTRRDGKFTAVRFSDKGSVRLEPSFVDLRFYSMKIEIPLEENGFIHRAIDREEVYLH